MRVNFKNTLFVVLLVSTIGLGALAWSQHRALASMRANVRTDDESDSGLRAKLSAAEKRAHDLENELAALKANKPEIPPGDGSQPEGPADDGGRRFRRGPEAFMAMMNDPKFVKMMNSREKTAIDSRYAALFKTLSKDLNLTPQQIDAFKDLLVEKQNTLRDVVMTARSEGVHDRAAIGELVKSAQADVDSQIQSTLGADGYSQYQQYEKTQPQRTLVTQLAQSLSYTSAPMTDEQQQQLLQILAANSSSTSTGQEPRGEPPGGPMGGPMGASLAQIPDNAIEQAKTVLDPNQLAALKTLQDQQKAQEEFVQTLRANRQGAPAAAPSAGTVPPVKQK
jgi:hypothetical protein